MDIKRKLTITGGSDTKVIVITACEIAGIAQTSTSCSSIKGHGFIQHIFVIKGDEKIVDRVIAELNDKWELDEIFDKNGNKL